MDEKEYNHCVNEYADHLFRFIVKNLHHEEDARDIVQTAFEKLWKHRKKVCPEKAKSYLFTIAYNQMIDHIRKHKPVQLEPDFSATMIARSGMRQMDQLDLKKILMAALGHLTDLQRSLILLKDYEGYSYQEIALITSLNETQVKVYLHRARLILKKFLISPENIL